MLVILVDEERYFAETVQALLEIEDFEVEHFSDATSAFQNLGGRADLPKEFCLLVDVALAAGSNRQIFSETRTERYLTTGIVLIEELFERHPWWKAHANNCIIYTAHYTTDLWDKMTDFATPRSIEMWQKRPNANGAEIVELIRNRISRATVASG